MTQQWKRYSTELKAKVPLEAIRGTRQPMRLPPCMGSCAGYMGDPLGTLLVNLFNYMVLCRRNAC